MLDIGQAHALALGLGRECKQADIGRFPLHFRRSEDLEKIVKGREAFGERRVEREIFEMRGKGQ